MFDFELLLFDFSNRYCLTLNCYYLDIWTVTVYTLNCYCLDIWTVIVYTLNCYCLDIW